MFTSGYANTENVYRVFSLIKINSRVGSVFFYIREFHSIQLRSLSINIPTFTKMIEKPPEATTTRSSEEEKSDKLNFQ